MARRARARLPVAGTPYAMDHLQEIEDAAARDGVNTFKTQMEVVVLSLLHEDRATALVQIEEAHAASLDYLDNIGRAFLSPDETVKAGRVALALLTHTFARLRAVVSSPDENGVSGVMAH